MATCPFRTSLMEALVIAKKAFGIYLLSLLVSILINSGFSERRIIGMIFLVWLTKASYLVLSSRSSLMCSTLTSSKSLWMTSFRFLMSEIRASLLSEFLANYFSRSSIVSITDLFLVLISTKPCSLARSWKEVCGNLGLRQMEMISSQEMCLEMFSCFLSDHGLVSSFNHSFASVAVMTTWSEVIGTLSSSLVRPTIGILQRRQSSSDVYFCSNLVCW